MNVPTKRLVAFIVDYIIWMILYAVFLGFLVVNNFLGDRIEDWAWIFVLVIMLNKDSFQGASIGKRLMGLAIRKQSNTQIPPNIAILMLRNLLVCLWPLELLFFILDNDHKRLADRLFKTVVISVKDNS